MKDLQFKDIYGGIKHNSNMFADVIFNNFKDIEADQEISHTENEIDRLVKSNKMYSMFAYDNNNNNNMVGYIIGEIIKSGPFLCFHIQYLYVVSSYRCHGIATKLIELSKQKMRNEHKINKITLTCNKKNKYNFNFYKNKGFNVDKLYMESENYCVMSHKIN